MEFYCLTESDPLQKFLFPCESEALRGNNLMLMIKQRLSLWLSVTYPFSSSAFCPDEMKTTLDKILHRGRLSIHRKVGLNLYPKQII